MFHVILEYHFSVMLKTMTAIYKHNQEKQTDKD